ncbi:hypothetical protein L6452_05901 [Arctium lappa]|uniref:Uncharacterized protein n=1 Tax=Arctium lappa TaxID=4217 RepID=A0ACB9EHZ0_ARCLA|nr:hypothetical protein L6452_05901 [Arctium lappa]
MKNIPVEIDEDGGDDNSPFSPPHNGINVVHSHSPSSSSALLSAQNPSFSSTAPHRNQIISLFFRCPLTSRSKRHPVSCCASQQPNMAALAKEAKLWGGRFEEGVTDAVERFTESISFDKALYKHDIMGIRAHASMLAKQSRHECPPRRRKDMHPH